MYHSSYWASFDLTQDWCISLPFFFLFFFINTSVKFEKCFCDSFTFFFFLHTMFVGSVLCC